jgi:dissimilatory sulfite reductase (desulfoviridin) alpha/beta subunit
MSRTLADLRDENLKIAYIQDIKNFSKFTLALNNVFKSYYGGLILDLYLIMKLGFDKFSRVVAEAYRANLISIANLPILLEKIDDNIINYINKIGVDYIILFLYNKKNFKYLKNLTKIMNIILNYNKYTKKILEEDNLSIAGLYVENASKDLINEMKKFGLLIINYGVEKSDINAEKITF